MPNEQTALEFSLDDIIGGKPMTPENVDLPTLRGFLEEVETLIKGDVSGISLADSRVQIKEGSVKVVTLVAQLLAADVRQDMAKLEQSGDLDAMQTKRAQIVEKWQMRARKSPTRIYSIGAGGGVPRIVIKNTTQLQHGSENGWVAVEKYLTGKVENAGGKHTPNVHLTLIDTGESIVVNATEQQLSSEKDNQLFKVVTLRVEAEQHLRTKALRNVRLLQIIKKDTTADERVLDALWKKGEEAWRDVKSATAWVESLRGNK